MPLLKLWAGSLVMLAAVSLPLQAASPVKVGSKIDTEGALLGNIILQVLESHGVPTVNKVQLGTTPVVRGAITSGELDIYPEYTGNGAFFFKDENDAAWKNAQQGYEKVKKLDSEHNKLIWLTPAPANNTWTIAVRQDVAEKNKLTSLADLSRYLQEGGTFKLAASAEFIERADALPAFEKAYGFKLGQDQLLSLAGGDTAVTIKAAAQQTSGVNAAMAYGTDGPVAALGLQTLSDPQGVQPIYAPAPVVRESVLKEYPQMAQWLQPVFASLDAKTLQQLNASIAVEGLDAKKVAADPQVLLMDEPFGALDPVTRGALQQEMTRIHRLLGRTIVLVTHDIDEALRLAEHLVLMDHGEVVQQGNPLTMLTRPANDFVRQFFGRSELGVRLLSLRSVADYVRREERAEGEALVEEMTLRDALSLFVARGCEVLPVVNTQGQPCGTLHFQDLLVEA